MEAGVLACKELINETSKKNPAVALRVFIQYAMALHANLHLHFVITSSLLIDSPHSTALTRSTEIF